MQRTKGLETLLWAAVGILLILAFIAPFFGDSPLAVVAPLLMAVILMCASLAQRQKRQKGSQAEAGGGSSRSY